MDVPSDALPEEATRGLAARWPLALAILRVLVAFGLLSVLYVLAKGPFQYYFRTAFEFLFVAASSWDVEFVPNVEPRFHPEVNDTLMKVMETEGGFGYICDSRFVALVPLTIYLALSAGPRMAWSRRWRATLVGLGLIHLYVFLRLSVYLLEQWTAHARDYPAHEHPAFLASGWWNEVIVNLSKLQADPAVYVTVPVLIWGLVSFRRLDWDTLLGRRPAANPAGE